MNKLENPSIKYRDAVEEMNKPRQEAQPLIPKSTFNDDRFKQLKENPDDLDRQTNLTVSGCDNLFQKCFENNEYPSAKFDGKSELYEKVKNNFKSAIGKSELNLANQEMKNIGIQLENIEEKIRIIKDNGGAISAELGKDRLYLREKQKLYQDVQEEKEIKKSQEIIAKYQIENKQDQAKNPELYGKVDKMFNATINVIPYDYERRNSINIPEDIKGQLQQPDQKALKFYDLMLQKCDENIDRRKGAIVLSKLERSDKSKVLKETVISLYVDKLTEFPIEALKNELKKFNEKIRIDEEVMTKDPKYKSMVDNKREVYARAIKKKRGMEEQTAIDNVREQIAKTPSSSDQQPKKAQPETKKPSEKIIWSETDNARLRILTKNNMRNPEEQYLLRKLLVKQGRYLAEQGRNDLVNLVNQSIRNLPRFDSIDLPLDKKAEIDKQYNL